MDERIIQFRVGVIVVASVLITGILVALFGEVPSLTRGNYPMYVRFREAPGVSEGTPVRKSGILIGRVGKTEFETKGEGVIVTLNIRGNVPLRRSEDCRIKGGLLGDAVIEFVPGDPKLANKMIEPGDYLDGSVTSNPLEVLSNMEGGLNQAVANVGEAGDEISKLAARLNKLLEGNDDQVGSILEDTQKAIRGFQKTLNSIDNVVGDEKVQEDLRRGITELPQLVKDTRQMFDGMQTAIERAERNLKNLEGLTKPLGDRGPELVDKIDSTVGRLDELLAQFVQFGKAINEEDGSLGQLVRDPELYQNLNRAARNIETLTRELRPIVKDARVFSDKLARHPENLGVRGLIQRSSGAK